MSHTHAPWKWDGHWLRGQGDLILWYTTDDNGVHAKPENARLIAAAPAMLEALEDLVSLAEHAMRDANRDGGEYDIAEDLKAARAAIRAAKGEA